MKNAEKSTLRFPDWVPRIPADRRVLVAGASGGIGKALVRMLRDGSDCIIGAHGRSLPAQSGHSKDILLTSDLDDAADCAALVERFVDAADGIDALVVLAGGSLATQPWRDLSSDAWESDVVGHLSRPFYLAQAAIAAMERMGAPGRIVLNGTESALHGGSPTSLPYACAKRATECLVQGLARDCAQSGILVNGVRFGFIDSGFHQRWRGAGEADRLRRIDMIPLKRGGAPEEAAALIAFLLSDWARFITGQMIPLTGGDWL